jgi:hypothetical protein
MDTRPTLSCSPPSNKRDLPGSWGTLLCMLRSTTPVDHRRRASHAAGSVAFRSENSVGSTICFISGLHHEAYRAPVYASPRRSPDNDATLGCGGWLALTAQDSHLRGSSARFLLHRLLYIPSFLPRLRLAQLPRKRVNGIPPTKPFPVVSRCCRATVGGEVSTLP